MGMWRNGVLLAVLALVGCATASADSPARSDASPDGKTIFIARHMRKAEGANPPLSAAGSAAAEHLALALANKGVSAIFATPTRRAMETAGPLSRRTGVAITEYDPANPEPLVSSARANAGAVLIVGHSNTVHDLVARLSGKPPAPLAEDDYGRVFVIDAAGNVSEFKVG